MYYIRILGHIFMLSNIVDIILRIFYVMVGHRGSTVVKVLCYKSEGRWFDSRWCHWNFSLT